ncbi:hypothetical protein PCANC_16295 [Puccinia coronata f. sp. avenae]|uniref:Uncharacterized protein n=1 Tax=Puccinia coronata f. sp. avenae TaxID=200324 RepID=A0A2N5UH19_9BASI|nr:hypothetical protein PCANC_16295 [Puccinia coronata f. sp. avenae]
MTVERPDNTLAVICGAVTKAHLQAVAASDEYKRILDKGEVPNKKLLRTAFTLDFIYENNKYQVLATRSAAGLYTLLCNGGKVSIGLRTLADGGLLVYSMVDLTLFTGCSLTHGQLQDLLQDSELPYGRSTAILSTLSGRMPAKLEASIRSALEAAHTKGPEFPSNPLRKIMDLFLDDGICPQDRQTVLNTLAPLEDVINRFKGGIKSHGYLTLSELMGAYYAVESIFSSNQEDDVILQLRDQNRDSLDEVVRLVLSHSKCSSKNQLILAVLDIVSKTASQAAVETTFHDSLSKLAQLDSKAAAKVALKAKEVLIHCQLPSSEERVGQMESILKTSLQPTVYGEANRVQPQHSYEVLRELVDSKYTVFDVLPTFYDHPNPWVALAALEVYVRQAYQSYSIVNFEYEEGDGLTGRLASFSDLTYVVNQLQDEPMRSGVMFGIKSLEDLDKFMSNYVLSKFPDVQPKLLNPDPDGEPQKIRLVAAEGTDVPKNCANVVVSIHTIATFQAFSDYLRPRIIKAKDDERLSRPSGSSPSRLSGMLAAFAAVAGLPTSSSSSPSTHLKDSGFTLPSRTEATESAQPLSLQATTSEVPLSAHAPRRSSRPSGRGLLQRISIGKLRMSL